MKETEYSYYILDNVLSKKIRVIRKNANRSFAYDNIKGALYSASIRSNRRLGYLRYQLEVAEKVKKLIDQEKEYIKTKK